jgi:hypothetical protein
VKDALRVRERHGAAGHYGIIQRYSSFVRLIPLAEGAR